MHTFLANTNERKMPNGNSFFVPVVSLDVTKTIDLNQEDQVMFGDFVSWIDNYNSYIINSWAEKVNSKLEDGDDEIIDDLVDIIQGGIQYVPCLYVLNKVDGITMEELELLDKVPHYVPISAHKEWNFDELLAKTWDYCNMARIYTKPKGSIPDYDEPVILSMDKKLVSDLCDALHKEIRAKFKYAWVWGSSVKHQPQKVGLTHELDDEDVVQIVKN